MSMPRFLSTIPRSVIIGVVCLLIGGAGGYFGASLASHGSFTVGLSREGGYEFINPLLSCDVSENTPYSGYNSFKESLEKTVSGIKQSGGVSRVSIYFRDLNSGFWTGVDPDDTFAPASLNKLPVAIGVLKEHALTDLPTTYASVGGTDNNVMENFKPAHPLALGGSYSLDALIKAAMQESDNNALAALYGTLASSTIQDVLFSFQVPETSSPTQEIISPKMYGRFFRILYNASYIGRVKSEYLLSVLSDDTFTGGLVAGIPENVKVSHKFGERSQGTASNGVGQSEELHDCGIVYYPGHPYLLCVMTEGNDFTPLTGAIRSVSQVVYAAVDKGLTSDLSAY